MIESFIFIIVVFVMIYFVFGYKENKENFYISPSEVCFLNKFIRLNCQNCMYKNIKNVSCNLNKLENQYRLNNNFKCEYFINKKTGLNKWF